MIPTKNLLKLNKNISCLALVLTLVAAGSALTSCSKKETKPDEAPVPTAGAADDNVLGDSDSGRALGLRTIHFPYDSYALTAEDKKVLDDNAKVLKEKSSAKIQIEGHCDQRGGIQYNIALGEKRANATKGYLVARGIAAERISTISYGKERPIDPATTEEAYAKNRRANFVITSR